MSLLNERHSSYLEFVSERENSNELLEFIDDIIFMSTSPNIKHQEISSMLHAELYNVLKDQKCKVFAAPTNVVFDDEKENDKKVVIPDLFVACDPDKFTENEYIGPPTFIIEILSPSSKSHDMVTKLNLYMNAGVKEYWIVDPIDERILVYSLDKHNEIQFELFELGKSVTSRLFREFEIDTKSLF